MKNKNNTGSAQVINFKSVRDAKIEEKRRKYERVIFKNALGAYCVVEGRALNAVELVDLSHEGLSFQLPKNSKNRAGVEKGQDFLLRLYFSQDTYINLSVHVLNVRDCIESGNNYVRYGCSVDVKSQSYLAYKAFVDFLGRFAEMAQVDSGELKLSYF